MIGNKDATVNMDNALSSINKYKFRLRDICCYPLTHLWCGIVGVIIGIIPGAGGSIAALWVTIRRNICQSIRKNSGTGYREGISGPESANNGVIGGALIPMMTLGIPGNAVTAILMGAFDAARPDSGKRFIYS